MASIAPTLPSRSRTRTGRIVRYFPTAAEAAVDGAGPYAAQISEVNSNGSADLILAKPVSGAAAKASVSKGNLPGTFDFFGI